jgi:hypothetical protein
VCHTEILVAYAQELLLLLACTMGTHTVNPVINRISCLYSPQHGCICH